MKVIIVGMGEAGKYIASVLANEKHDVIIIDENIETLMRAEESTDAMALHGHGASMRKLRQAKAETADLLIAVTGKDEINLLAAITARQLGTKITIARVTNRDYLDEEERGFYHNLLGIDLVISEDILVANEIYKIIKSVGALSVENFIDNRVEMIQISVDDKLKVTDKPLRTVEFPENTLVAAIVRNNALIIPTGFDEILLGDEVFLIGTIDKIPRLEKLFGKTQKSAHKVVIIGGGEVGFSIAKKLERDDMDVVIIEMDPQRCVELSDVLNQAVVIHGDGTDIALLREEHIPDCDVFVAVSGDDEINMAASLLAKNLGAKKIVTLANRADYIPIYELMKIDATISPWLFSANQILKYARPNEVISVSLLEDGKAEFLELVAAKNSHIVNKPLKDVNIPRGTVITAVASLNHVFVPRGKDVIQPGDRVLLLTTPRVRDATVRLFRKRILALG